MRTKCRKSTSQQEPTSKIPRGTEIKTTQRHAWP